MNYWRDCIVGALADLDIKATPEQIHKIAIRVENAHENYKEEVQEIIDTSIREAKDDMNLTIAHNQRIAQMHRDQAESSRQLDEKMRNLDRRVDDMHRHQDHMWSNR